MTVVVSMEENITLTESVSVTITTYDKETGRVKLTIADKMNVSLKVVEGTEEEVTALINKKMTLNIDGRITQAIEKKAEGVSKRRTGCAKHPEMEIR